MAIRGRKPTATVLRLVTGSHLKDRPVPKDEPIPGGAVERPEKMRKHIARIWDRWVGRAFWLTWADSPKALMWCHLQHETEKMPHLMTSARIAQWRALGSELGLDPGSRRRLGANGGGNSGATKDPASKYLT